MEKNLTTGSVFKNILFFSLPYLFSYFLQTLYGMADLFITGQFDGTADVTAVANGSQVMHMLTVMIVGLAMGSTVNIAQSVGAGKKSAAADYIGNTVTLFMALSLVLTAVLAALVRPIVSLIATPEEAVEGAVRYLLICFLGIPFITAYNIISSIFRGLGDSRTPMYFISAACLANIVLDYLFIGAFGMGAAGAALGTVLAQAISVAISLAVILRKKTGIPLKKECFRPKMPVMNAVLGTGFPVAVQDGFIQVSFMVITVIANQRGLTDAAAVGIVEKIISFLFLVPSTMLSTVSALAAQNIGAGRTERAKQTLRYAILLCAGFGLFAGLVIQFTAEPLVRLFDGSDDVVRAGGQYLRGYVWDCFFAGIHFSFSGYFCACKKSGLSFLHNVISIVCARVPGAYLTSRMFADTLFPMGLAIAAGSFLSVIVCVIAWRWLERRQAESYT